MDFQTPGLLCEKIVRLLAIYKHHMVLEPSSGEGNFIEHLKKVSDNVHENSIEKGADFLDYEPVTRYHWIVGNPPFSPMSLGYQFVEKAYTLLAFDGTIAFILPWLFMINSVKRTKRWEPYIHSIYHLPRNVFPGSRVQTALFIIGKHKSHSISIDFDEFANWQEL